MLLHTFPSYFHARDRGSRLALPSVSFLSLRILLALLDVLADLLCTPIVRALSLPARGGCLLSRHALFHHFKSD